MQKAHEIKALMFYPIIYIMLIKQLNTYSKKTKA